MEPTPQAARPLFGFNSDVSYRTHTYHVQTESMAEGQPPTINTLVYLRGTLVRKIANPCSDLGTPASPGALEERVRRQHLDVLGQIKRGEITDRTGGSR